MLSKKSLSFSIQRRFSALRYRLQLHRRVAYCIVLSSVLVIALILLSMELLHHSSPSALDPKATVTHLRTNHAASSVVSLPSQSHIQSTNCRDFDAYGNRSAASNADSIFNCGSIHGLCTWYYPAKFFDPTCGAGREYNHWLSYMEQQRLEKTLWPGGMPPIVLPWASLSPHLVPTFRADPFPVHNISMIHVHKTGGTSMVLAFDSLRRLGAPMERHVSYLQSMAEPKATLSYNKTSLLLNGAVRYTQEMGPNDHTLIAVVRDPAQRFISAIGQAMGGQGSNTKVASELRQTCLKGTARETLRCCVDKIQQEGFWFEVHFTPMVLEISFASLFKDIPIAIFPFSAVPKLMYELDQDPSIKRKDGSSPGYRKDPILTKMSLDDYDEGILRDFCDLYRVDTLFLQYLGQPSTCDKYL